MFDNPKKNLKDLDTALRLEEWNQEEPEEASPDALETCMPYIPEYDIVRFSASAIYPNKERKYKLNRRIFKGQVPLCSQ